MSNTIDTFRRIPYSVYFRDLGILAVHSPVAERVYVEQLNSYEIC